MIGLPNGVDVGPFLNAQFSPDLRRTLGGDKFLIGFVGSLKPWHGLELLLEAVHSLPG